MNPEELAAKLAELEAKAAKADDLERKYAELEAKVNPPAPDPDEQYKPQSWKNLHETVDKKAEEAALRILQDAEKKKDEEKRHQDDLIAENNKKIDDAFKKLQEEGIIEESKDKSDKGGWQRAQILGSLVASGGVDVEKEARKMKSLWDQGMEYDYESNSIRKQGYTASPTRNAVVGSSANSVAPAPSGTVDLRGTKGDLDEIQKRYEAKFGKA